MLLDMIWLKKLLMPMKKIMINYSITITSNHWPRRLKKIKKIIKLIIKQKKLFCFQKNINYYCNFVLTNDVYIKKLNRIYKKNNTSTDVLTFISNVKKRFYKNEKHCDIMLSANTLNKDATKNDINFYDHVAHLIVHCLLHVNGYTHVKKNDYLLMKNKEIKILQILGISNPYI